MGLGSAPARTASLAGPVTRNAADRWATVGGVGQDRRDEGCRADLGFWSTGPRGSGGSVGGGVQGGGWVLVVRVVLLSGGRDDGGEVEKPVRERG
jgi:hypothetical protein